jgi:hypothetical protein
MKMGNEKSEISRRKLIQTMTGFATMGTINLYSGKASGQEVAIMTDKELEIAHLEATLDILRENLKKVSQEIVNMYQKHTHLEDVDLSFDGNSVNSDLRGFAPIVGAVTGLVTAKASKSIMENDDLNSGLIGVETGLVSGFSSYKIADTIQLPDELREKYKQRRRIEIIIEVKKGELRNLKQG